MCINASVYLYGNYDIIIVMVDVIILGTVGAIDLYVVTKLFSVFRRLSVKPSKYDVNETDLPTVSVCITARDETHAMTQCLERVVGSDYPKLEVIVLDDQSHDDTSILIKSFAHSGVRFVEGKPLVEGWLGKNHAQARLADEASGQIVFFMDVDTMIARHTIASLVQYYLRHKARMVSVVPIRNDHWTMSTLFTTMRHFWTLMRFRPHAPRAVANAWLIDRKTVLDQLETDASLPISVQMETTIAKKLAKTKEYRLTMSNKWLGLSYEKRWSSQVETSIRLLYPQSSGNSIQVAWLITLLATVLLPYVFVWWYPWMLGAIVGQYLLAFYYLSRVWVRYRVIGALLLPLTVIQEILLLIISTYRYNFGTITWKGRPVQRVRK